MSSLCQLIIQLLLVTFKSSSSLLALCPFITFQDDKIFAHKDLDPIILGLVKIMDDILMFYGFKVYNPWISLGSFSSSNKANFFHCSPVGVSMQSESKSYTPFLSFKRHPLLTETSDPL